MTNSWSCLNGQIPVACVCVSCSLNVTEPRHLIFSTFLSVLMDRPEGMNDEAAFHGPSIRENVLKNVKKRIPMRR